MLENNLLKLWVRDMGKYMGNEKLHSLMLLQKKAIGNIAKAGYLGYTHPLF